MVFALRRGGGASQASARVEDACNGTRNRSEQTHEGPQTAAAGKAIAWPSMILPRALRLLHLSRSAATFFFGLR